jgi:hypothetical protein
MVKYIWKGIDLRITIVIQSVIGVTAFMLGQYARALWGL